MFPNTTNIELKFSNFKNGMLVIFDEKIKDKAARSLLEKLTLTNTSESKLLYSVKTHIRI